MTRTIVDVHIIQTVPPANLNRDDTGSPKTAVFGGTRRARVSSQAWKRAVRNDFREYLDKSKLGRRTKQVVATLAAAIADRDPDLAERAEGLAAETFTAAGITVKPPKGKAEGTPESGYLLFLSNQQYDKLADEAVKAERNGEKLDKKALKAIVNSDHSVDIALFGRMVADSADLNVDAACQVAHAISVHSVETEFDYYTAVDDTKEDAKKSADDDASMGAGMIGTVEFNSATLYRYATLNADMLNKNLGATDATAAAVEAFVRAFVRSMPTGKQNTFANRTLPDLVAVRVRGTQSINLAGAFEQALDERKADGRVATAVGRLGEHLRDIEDAYGEAPEYAWYCAVGALDSEAFGEPVGFQDLAVAVREAVAGRLGAA